jgi:hypothetical protein
MTITECATTKHPDIAYVTIDVEPPAARLRFKGRRMRYTDWKGKTWDYQVTAVSMPDNLGRCTLTVEPLA